MMKWLWKFSIGDDKLWKVRNGLKVPFWNDKWIDKL